MELEEAKRKIARIAVIRGWNENVAMKFANTFAELGEAHNAVKRRRSEHEIAEELVDVVINVLDLSRRVCPSIDMDRVLISKLDRLKGNSKNYVEDIVRRFKERKLTFARVSVNNEPTRVTIDYEPKKITINHLGEQLPPFVRIWKDKRVVEASFDKLRWCKVGKKSGRELQIYLLLDPTFLLPKVEVQRTAKLDLDTVLIDGFYDIQNLELFPIIGKLFKGENHRWIRIYASKGILHYITQQDFPPHNDSYVTVIFDHTAAS